MIPIPQCHVDDDGVGSKHWYAGCFSEKWGFSDAVRGVLAWKRGAWRETDLTGSADLEC